jgi:hypothetical protein
VALFKRGDRLGLPIPVTNPEIIDQINEIILEVRLILTKSITQQLDISRERVGSIVPEDLNMRKLSEKWVLKCLNVDQKRQWCHSSEQYLELFRREPNYFLSRLLTKNEKLVISLCPRDKRTMSVVAAYRLTPTSLKNF